MNEHVQWCQIENQQSPVYDMKWGHFDRVKSTFRMLLSSLIFDTVFIKIRSFDAKNLGPVDLTLISMGGGGIKTDIIKMLVIFSRTRIWPPNIMQLYFSIFKSYWGFDVLDCV